MSNLNLSLTLVDVKLVLPQLCQRETEEEYVSSVSWIKQGNVLAVGDSLGQVQLWDAATSKLMRSMNGHSDR